MDQPISVLCVDDNQLLAEALERRLSIDNRFRWSGWVSHASNLMEVVRSVEPDVVLLDIDMPGPDPFDLVVELSAARPQTRVLIFSAYVRKDYIDRAVQTGAWGYVSKNEGMPEVLDAIVKAVSGEFVLSSDALGEQRLVPWS